MMAWRDVMQSRIIHKADSVDEYRGIAEACFTMTTSEWERECMEPTEQGARMAEFNSYLAEGLHGSMDPKSEQVIWLRHCLGEFYRRRFLVMG